MCRPSALVKVGLSTYDAYKTVLYIQYDWVPWTDAIITCLLHFNCRVALVTQFMMPPWNVKCFTDMHIGSRKEASEEHRGGLGRSERIKKREWGTERDYMGEARKDKRRWLATPDKRQSILRVAKRVSYMEHKKQRGRKRVRKKHRERDREMHWKRKRATLSSCW